MPEVLFALPDDAAFSAIEKHNRCNVNRASPACQRSAYTTLIVDVNGDGIHDTLAKGGPFAGGGEVIYLGLGFLPESRKEVFVGDCDKTGFLGKQEFTCTADGKTKVISLAAGKVREATDAEVALSDANVVESRASEARTNLLAIYAGQKSRYAERDAYSTNASAIGFAPTGNRYTYLLAPSGEGSIIGPDSGKYPKAQRLAGLREAHCPLTFGTSADGEPIGLGVTGKPPNQEFIAYAIGDVDDDPDFDCWSIASFERRTSDGRPVPAGQPLHEKTDYVESAAGKAVGKVAMAESADSASLNLENSPQVEAIRGRFKDINTRQFKLKKVEKTLWGLSTEGATLVTYSEGAVLKKAALSILGESGNSKSEFYFAGDRVEFVFVEGTQYLPGTYDAAGRSQTRYYFVSGKLYWATSDADRKAMPKEEYAEKERLLLNEASLILKAAKTPGYKLRLEGEVFVRE